MESCEKYREWISASVDGELTPDEEAELRRHLDGCAECRRLYDLFSAVYENPEQFDREPPAELTGTIMEKIAAAAPAKAPKKHAVRRWIAAGLAVAACIAVFFAAKPLLAPKASTATAEETNAACYYAAGAPEESTAGAAADSAQSISLVSCTAVKMLDDGSMVAFTTESNDYVAPGTEFIVEIVSVADKTGAGKTLPSSGDTFTFTAEAVAGRDNMLCFQGCVVTITQEN